jgi:hypothetical protein
MQHWGASRETPCQRMAGVRKSLCRLFIAEIYVLILRRGRIESDDVLSLSLTLWSTRASVVLSRRIYPS